MFPQENELKLGLLPGLKPVREASGISAVNLAQSISVTHSYLSRVQACDQACSIETLDKLAKALLCRVDDLMYVPNETRLAEIRIAHLKRDLYNAEAELAKLLTGGVSTVAVNKRLSEMRLASLRDQAKQEQDRLEHLQFLEVCGETEEAA